MKRFLGQLAIAVLSAALGACGGGGNVGEGSLPTAESPVAVSAPSAALQAAQTLSAKDGDSVVVQGLVAEEADNKGGVAAALAGGPESLALMEERAVNPYAGMTGPRPGSITTYTYSLLKVQEFADITDPFEWFAPNTANHVLDILNSPEYAGAYYGGLHPYTGIATFIRASSIPAYAWDMRDSFDDRAGKDKLLLAEFGPRTETSLTSKFLYGKPAADTAIYDQSKVAFNSMSESREVFLERLNQAGALGYCRLGQEEKVSLDAVLLMKQRSSDEVCHYQIAIRKYTTQKEYQDYLNIWGRDGYIPILEASSVDFMVKVVDEPSSFYYYIVDAVAPVLGSSMEDFQKRQVAQLNAEGLKGAKPWRPEFTMNGQNKQVYRIATNCTRWWMCNF